MTDPFAAAMWAIVAGIFVTNAVYACLLSRHYDDPILGALAWMFISLALGTAMIGLLRSGWGIIPLTTLKVIERSAFVIASVNGFLVMEIATGRWQRSDTVRRLLQWWNHLGVVG